MDTKRVLSFFSLFTSMSTLICCALPALLVSIGLGAVMAGLAANVPALIWVSENKAPVFVIAGAMLGINGIILWLNRDASCPIEPKLREACLKGRRISKNVFLVSVAIFLLGYFFAFIVPNLTI